DAPQLLEPSLSCVDPSRTDIYAPPLHDALPIWDTSRVNEILNRAQIRSLFPRDIKFRWTANSIDVSGNYFRLIALKAATRDGRRSEEHTSELQSRENLVCRLLLEKKNTSNISMT